MEVFMALSLLVMGICVSLALTLKWNEMRFRRKGLPPGTMGWPIFGETTDFLRQGPEFMKKQRARYGSVFKSHILGCPTVVSMDPELNRYILLNEGKGLVPGYPQSMLDILGKCNIAAVHGSTHRYIRGSMLSLIGPPVIKDRLLAKIDKFLRIHLQDWDGKTIDIQEKTNDMALFVSFKQIVETESAAFYEAFKVEFDKLVLGSLSLPINIRGTNYHQGFQGRKRVISILKKIIEEKRASSVTNDGMIDSLLGSEDSKYELSEEEILDQIITILYSGYETVSTTSMMAIKYIHDHPRALQELRDEHFKIRKGKGPEEPLGWDDYKSMTFTRAVIFETLRLATVVNGVLRKTTADMKLNGYIIPKGWRIYVYTREINYDPFLYPEPLTFDPWRWLEKSLESHNYCFLFGGGSRLCPGKELGIATISTFLHYFVTSYRWEEIQGQKIMQFPRVEAPNGLHIRVFKY
ncbi:hypothetical protein RJ640_008035 [Escallonia rubra]|uniref:C6-oxidase n=1 Tax=Escallonia rubra TaxID=112253 RepID=A0AA88R5Z2_9ASTE|nr:hypothetical protein RJ640_008035 [Escallonia rubra]